MNNIQEEKLTKKERYLLRREQKEKERLQKARRKKIRNVLFVLLPILLLVGGISFGLMNYLSQKEESHPETPKIEINPEEYDAGTISMSAGSAKYTYEIKNIGEGDLKIDRIWTSCHCTTARLRVGDKTSGEFGMQSNPIFWSQKIAPGETGFLEVTFDPAFHKEQGTGPVVRAVYLSTNDPQNKKVEARLIANVIE